MTVVYFMVSVLDAVCSLSEISMRDGYYKEVDRLYHTQMKQFHSKSPEHKEIHQAFVRVIRQLGEMCIAEHGSHKSDNSSIPACIRCGVDLDRV